MVYKDSRFSFKLQVAFIHILNSSAVLFFVASLKFDSKLEYRK